MASLISLIVILMISVLITKIAAEALMHTGLSKESAKFQARSAFTGVGYTTRESEKIVNHPVRRRIVMGLMLIGNVGIISAVASLILTFVNSQLDPVDNIIRIAIIIASLTVLWMLSKSKWLERKLVAIIDKALEKYTNIKVKDYVELLKLKGEYEITVIKVKEKHWMENKNVGDLQLREEGINIIGIHRADGTYIGTPDGKTRIVAGDQLILYGREKALLNLEKRRNDREGDIEHETAKKEQDLEKGKERVKDKVSQKPHEKD